MNLLNSIYLEIIKFTFVPCSRVSYIRTMVIKFKLNMKLKTFLFSLLLLAFLSCNNNNDTNEKLLHELESLKVENDTLMELLTREKIEPIVSETPQWYYPETDSRELLEAGVEDPKDYIKNALLERIDLIPIDAVLGGTMRYNNIQILGDKWIIADFEDGHVYGKAIFEYEIKDKDQLQFKIIALSQN